MEKNLQLRKSVKDPKRFAIKKHINESRFPCAYLHNLTADRYRAPPNHINMQISTNFFLLLEDDFYCLFGSPDKKFGDKNFKRSFHSRGLRTKMIIPYLNTPPQCHDFTKRNSAEN